ncbi:MAG TPA: hypothetical protein VN804_01135, partial [Solirubrobacteraceae bacterium]|nr:hypothetical protein [Solirubrobacteraceae bacterium]
MRRLSHVAAIALLLAALLLAALMPAASANMPASASVGTSASASACASRSARDLHLTRLPKLRARLSWKPPKASGAGAISYRVQRSGRTVGQTTHASLVL